MPCRYCAALFRAWLAPHALRRMRLAWPLPACVLIGWVLLSSDLRAHADARVANGGAAGAITFATYPDLAAAFHQRTADASTPTPAIAALAHRLTAGLPDAHARARALSDWVRLHVRLDDPGATWSADAPRPAQVVLTSLHGHGVEMAALLQALLTASGIDNTAALVRRGSDATLPVAPTPATFDHVLVHVLSLGLYLDPSSTEIAAGYLPPDLLGKPVLLVDGGRFAMTPQAQAEAVRSMATIEVRRDGSAAFRIERTYAGALAEPVRTTIREAPPAVRTAFVQRVALDLGRQGHAALDDARIGAAGDVHVTLSGLAEHFMHPADARRLATTYPHLSTIADVMSTMRNAVATGPPYPCPAIDAEDALRLQLPPGMRIAALPPAVDVIEGGVFYRAAYAREGNAVLVKRHLTVRSGRPVCTPAEFSAMQAARVRIARDLDSRIVIAAR